MQKLTQFLWLVSSIALLLALAQVPESAYAGHFPWDQGHDTFEPEEPNDDDDPGDDSCPPNSCCLGTRGASPVEFAIGNFTHSVRIVRIEGLGPEIDITLTYNSRDNRKGPFGHGWVHQYDQRLIQTTDGVAFYAICTKANGKRERFTLNPDGSYTPPPYLFDTLTRNPDGSFTLRDHLGKVRRFNAQGQLVAMEDRNGNALTFAYDAAGFMTRMTDAVGTLRRVEQRR